MSTKRGVSKQQGKLRANAIYQNNKETPVLLPTTLHLSFPVEGAGQVLACIVVRSGWGWLLAPWARKGKELAGSKLQQKVGEEDSEMEPETAGIKRE